MNDLMNIYYTYIFLFNTVKALMLLKTLVDRFFNIYIHIYKGPADPKV